MRSTSWFKVVKSHADGNGDGASEILVYDEIGAGGVGAIEFNRELKALGPDCKAITLRFNSYGGDSFCGVAIYNMLAAHPAKKTGYNDGICASAASLILMACDKIIAPDNTFMVVHNPRAVTAGDAQTHRSMADDLDRVTGSYAATYSKRSKQPLAAVRTLMAADRLMTAKEAKSLGYVDQVTDAAELVATFDLAKLAPAHKAAASAFSIVAGKRLAQEKVRAEMGIGRR